MGVSVRGTEPPELSASFSSLRSSLLARSLDIIVLPESCLAKHCLQYWPCSPPTKLQCAACEEQVIAANLNQMVKDIVLPRAFTGGATTQTLSHLHFLFVILTLPLCLFAQQVCPVIYRLSNNEKQLLSLYGPPLIWRSRFFTVMKMNDVFAKG